MSPNPADVPPAARALLDGLAPGRLGEILQAPEDPRSRKEYLHWDKIRHLDPPPGLSTEEWWLSLKFARGANRQQIPLKDTDGRSFGFVLPRLVLRSLRVIDQQCSGQIAMAEVVTADASAKQHYLVNSLMEEAIRSSQLEGATTTRRAAKELLQSGRAPRDRSERMILNNYRALQYMRESIGPRLSPSAVIELQRILTDGTLDNPDASGRLQRPEDDRVSVIERLDGSVIHTPPPAEQLPGRLEAMCAFANADDDEDGDWIHPVVRGVLLHFWLAYDHPFEDGNGRTARALFYWFMRERGYWLVEYLSISHILREAPSQYSRAFVRSETDEGDTTYFIAYQLQVIERAIKQLQDYLARQVAKVRAVEELIRDSEGFNHRQLALLGDALRDPERTYTFATHAGQHGVTRETARTDLSDLALRGLLVRRKVGREFAFGVPSDLVERLEVQR